MSRRNYGSAMTEDRHGWRYLSPSTLMSADPQTSEGCLRRCYFEKVMELKAPQTRAQAEGTELHAQVEHYLLTGDRSGMGQLASAGLHQLPLPRTVDDRILIEHDIAEGSLETAPLRAAGVPIFGYIDCVHWRGTNAGTSDIEDTVDPAGTVEVIDWKTTSDPRWIKSPQEVARTLQMTTYGKWAIETKGAEWVRLSHGYFVTKGRHTPRKVSLRVHKDQINERWEYVDKLAGSLVEVVKETNPDNVPANTRACDAFRGCPHRSYCSAGAHNSLSAYVGADLAASVLGISAPTVTTLSQESTGKYDMSLLDKLKGAKPAETPKEDLQRKLLAEEIEAKYPGAMDAVLALEALGHGMPQLAGEAAHVYCVAKNQPISVALTGSGDLGKTSFSDASQLKAVLAEARELFGAEATPAEEPAPVAAPTEIAPLDPFPDDAPPALASEPVAEEKPPVVDAASAMAAAASDAPKKRRGRPSKAELAARAAEVTPEPTPVAETPVAEIVNVASEPAKVATATEATSITNVVNYVSAGSKAINLFVDCIPSTPYQSFWPLIEKVTDAIAKRCGAVDYRACPKGTEGEYGQWKGMLAAGLKALYTAGGIPAGDYVLDFSMNETAGVAVEAMREAVASSGGKLVRSVR